MTEQRSDSAESVPGHRRLRWELETWIRTHGGAVDESDYDAQGALVDTFFVPLLAIVWERGFNAGAAHGGTPRGSFGLNPYVKTTVTPPVDHASFYGSPGRHEGAREDCRICPPTTVTSPAGGHKSTRRADTSQPTRDTAPRGR